MRDDMAKVIVERPRAYRGHKARGGCKYPRHSSRSGNEHKLETLPQCQGMRAPHQRRNLKSLNENLVPLGRYLRSQVGRPWNKVFSEISEHLSVRSAVQKHVFEHLENFVSFVVEERNGELYGRQRNGVFSKIVPFRLWRSLYVCPKTGLLRSVNDRAKRKDQNQKKVSETLYLLRRRGIWYGVETRALPESIDQQRRCFDVVVRERVSTTEWYRRMHEIEYAWTLSRYAVAMFQLSQKEKRDYL